MCPYISVKVPWKNKKFPFIYRLFFITNSLIIVQKDKFRVFQRQFAHLISKRKIIEDVEDDNHATENLFINFSSKVSEIIYTKNCEFFSLYFFFEWPLSFTLIIMYFKHAIRHDNFFTFFFYWTDNKLSSFKVNLLQ